MLHNFIFIFLGAALLSFEKDITDQMQAHKVPGISITLVNDGKIEWSKGYGHVSPDPKSQPVDEHTQFQAASISKPITAFGALLLVQAGKLALDDDVNKYLKRWKVARYDFDEKVTLRRLLSHTAGVNVDGFEGYTSTVPIPSLVEILEGKKPLVNSDPIKVVKKPGSALSYSGGGTTIVQLLIEDVTGENFDVWMQNNVLKPLGMHESTFVQRSSLQGHIYPEMGAAGLWTTSNDLAKFILYLQHAIKEKKAEPLHFPLVQEMLTRQKVDGKEVDASLGLFMHYEGPNLAFMHDGQNAGFIAALFGYVFLEKGVVIMMNSELGWPMMQEMTKKIAKDYNWPYFD